MTVQLYAFTCGTVTSDRERFLDRQSGKITVPVPAYLIMHPQGKVLFDTGLSIALHRDAARLHPEIKDSWDIDFPVGADIVSQLARLGIAPCDIRFVVNSHLHFDHCGGNAYFPKATMVVHAKEWRAGHMKVMQDAGVYNPLEFEHMVSVMQLAGEQDLFGDGTVVVFPTPGHTPGHQSMRVKLAAGDVVLAADCCYLKQTLDAMHLPKFSYNVEQMKESLYLLRRLRASGARIFFGHDLEFWKTVPQAPAKVE